MKKILASLALTPLAITSCTAKTTPSTNPPKNTPSETSVFKDEKVNTAKSFTGYGFSLPWTDSEGYDRVCEKYADESFNVNGESCKPFLMNKRKSLVNMGIERYGLSSYIDEPTGSDEIGWTVNIRSRSEVRISYLAKFNIMIDEKLKLYQMSNPSMTREDLLKMFDEDSKKTLETGTLYSYVVVKSGDSYKVKSLTIYSHGLIPF